MAYCCGMSQNAPQMVPFFSFSYLAHQLLQGGVQAAVMRRRHGHSPQQKAPQLRGLLLWIYGPPGFMAGGVRKGEDSSSLKSCMGSPQQTSSPWPALFTSTTLSHLLHL